jgi:hypothetical protein
LQAGHARSSRRIDVEKVAYAILLVLAALWLGGILLGMVVAFPWGLIGLAALAAFGLLFIKVLKERLQSSEDDYYEKNVDQ